jgi:hypothetical protein
MRRKILNGFHGTAVSLGGNAVVYVYRIDSRMYRMNRSMECFAVSTVLAGVESHISVLFPLRDIVDATNATKRSLE